MQTQDEIKNRVEELKITREGQIADRFTASVEQLGNKSDDVRLGGIYSLQRIIRDSEKDQPAIVDILSAYVRAHAPSTNKNPPKDGRPADADVLAAVNILSSRNSKRDKGSVIDWSHAYLWDASLPSAALPGASLAYVDLGMAELGGADLSESDLSEANFAGAQLQEVNFSGAYIGAANFGEEDIGDSVVVGADLTKADLSDVDLTMASFRGARLEGADFSGACLFMADLTEAEGLTVGQITQARVCMGTKLPPRLANNPRLRERVREGGSWSTPMCAC